MFQSWRMFWRSAGCAPSGNTSISVDRRLRCMWQPAQSLTTVCRVRESGGQYRAAGGGNRRWISTSWMQLDRTSDDPIFSVGHKATCYGRNAQVGPVLSDHLHDGWTNTLVELARVRWRCESSDRNRAQKQQGQKRGNKPVRQMHGQNSQNYQYCDGR